MRVHEILGFTPPAWMRDGACQEHPELDWFADHAVHQAQAKAVCERCLVRDECLTFALEHEERYGVWGGLTETDRRAMRRDAA